MADDVVIPPCTGCNSSVCEDCRGPLGGRPATRIYPLPDDPRPGLFFVVAGLLVGAVVGAVTATAILGLTIWTGVGGVVFAWVCGGLGGWLANRRERR